MRRFGEFVESLNGNYVTAEDVGMTTRHENDTSKN